MTAQLPDGVHQLHTREDALGLRESLGRGGRVVVVGDGLLASEAVSAAQASGCNVTLLVRGSAPLQAVPGASAHAVATLHRRNGVQVLSDAQVAGIHRSGASLTVTLADGWQCPADIVLLALDQPEHFSTIPGRLAPIPALSSLQ